MDARAGEGLERRRLGLRLGTSGQSFGSPDLVGVGLLFLDQPLNREPTEPNRLSREWCARSIVASEDAEVTESGRDAAGTNVSALEEELAEPFRCFCEGGGITVIAREGITAGPSWFVVVGTNVSDEAFPGEGRPGRPSRSLLN